MKVLRIGAFALTVTAIAAGCSSMSGGSGATGQLPATTQSENSQQPTAESIAGATSGHLYVVRPFSETIATPTPMPIPGLVRVFPVGSTHEAWTVPDADASAFQFSIALDKSENVYEAHEDDNDVAVFPPNSRTELRRIRTGLLHPFSLWFDKTGNLYVTNYPTLATPTPTPSGSPPPTPPPTPPASLATLPPGWISIYAPGASKPFRKITSPNRYVPMALAFDSVGNVYVANGPADDNPNRNVGLVDIYSAHGAHERTISSGVQAPTSIAVDATVGTVYVGNGNGGVEVYAAGQNTPSYSLPAGLARALLVDSSGHLYVGDFSQPGGVSEYARTGRKPIRTLSAGFLGVDSLALDAAGNLYAADQFDNNVFVYAPGQTQALRTISTSSPGYVLIGP